MPRIDGDDSFHHATPSGSISPPVRNFRRTLRARGYGMCLLDEIALDGRDRPPG
jgi:hypothetical protein